jgi:heterotetrameric sarcosine oxidase delta subunit
MLRIPCPYCGTRDQDEFKFGGESHLTRPAQPERASDADWAEYLFYRKNPKGIHHERWLHSFGCRRWFNLARNTVTHEIVEAYAMGGQPAITARESDGNG